jgi:hypothetical protein
MEEMADFAEHVDRWVQEAGLAADIPQSPQVAGTLNGSR